MSMTATMQGSFNKLEVFRKFCELQKWSPPRVLTRGKEEIWMTNVTGRECDGSIYSRENLWVCAETGAVKYDSDYASYLRPHLNRLFDPQAKNEKGESLPSDAWNCCDVQMTLQQEGLQEGTDFEVIREDDSVKIRLFAKEKNQLAEAELGE